MNEFVQAHIPVPQYFAKWPIDLKNGNILNDNEHPHIESIFIFSIIWGNTTFLREESKEYFHSFFLKRLRNYKINHSGDIPFANNLLGFFKENVIFILYFFK